LWTIFSWPVKERFGNGSRILKILANEERSLAEVKPGSYFCKISKACTGDGYPTMALLF